jgi:hypothetical protein
MPASGPCTVAISLLVPQDRVARASIPAWVRRLRATLSEARRGERRVLAFAETVGRLANNAALIAAFQGASYTAEALCRSQIRWQRRTSRRSRDPRVAPLEFQPWVNLGRLQALSGDWKGAIERFSCLSDDRRDRWYCHGDNCEPVPSCAGASARGYRIFLRNVFVVDSLKALLMNARYEDALEFAQRERGDDRNAAALCEAQVVAYCRMSRPDVGARIAREARRGFRGWERAVFSLRLIESLAGEGCEAEAIGELARVVKIFSGLNLTSRTRVENLSILHRAAQLCIELGVPADAARLAAATLEGALVANDEVLVIESLRVLCSSGSTPDAKVALELNRLEATTGYARYRRGGQSPFGDEDSEAHFLECTELFAR